MNPEQQRIDEAKRREHHWRRWGPYLAERQWGTVREDYSANGDAWGHVTHDMARAYAYRWGEDGLGGISDNHQRLCFAIALWNGQDPILKERLFGLSNPQGNHGEDVKEYYWFEDATPSHSYLRFRYRYPLSAYPYEELVSVNAERDRAEPEFELADTGVFDENRFADVSVEYAKDGPDDIYIRVQVTNRSQESARLQVIPSLWFRNDWSWQSSSERPTIKRQSATRVRASHPTLGAYTLRAEGDPELLFTENETNYQLLYDSPNTSPYTKDAFHRYLVEGDNDAVSGQSGTKCGFLYQLDVEAGGSQTIALHLGPRATRKTLHANDVYEVFSARRAEADEFFAAQAPPSLTPSEQQLFRQAMAGMIWTKQWYHFSVEEWSNGDPGHPPPPTGRKGGRNKQWTHLYSEDILSMPDSWEYPWFAVWDSAFHALPFAHIDPDFAKRQLTRFTREWYMHPNGQLPAYEWSFSDVNPPVHAWSAFQVFQIDRARTGEGDTAFLESVFHKLLMNFTWWVNRKDNDENNVFEGGFLGMDNIGVFDRSNPPPSIARLDQSDGTSWMAAYSLHLLAIAWELSEVNPAYEDIASKFFEHFLHIAKAVHGESGEHMSLWHEEDGFFYDQLHYPDGTSEPLRIRSMVGLIPLLAIDVLDYDRIDKLPGFKRRMEWFFENRPDLTGNIYCVFDPERSPQCVLSLLNPEQLQRVLAAMLDEDEFLSPFGIRSLSKRHEKHPFWFEHDGRASVVTYEPGESKEGMFGGNSNWRGPIWFPINHILIDALEKYHTYWGDTVQVECPTGSGNKMNLHQVARELRRRLLSLFELKDNQRPIFHGKHLFADDPNWRDHILFYEFFHADTGEGLGASHQTGWTGLVANLLIDQAETEPTS